MCGKIEGFVSCVWKTQVKTRLCLNNTLVEQCFSLYCKVVSIPVTFYSIANLALMASMSSWYPSGPLITCFAIHLSLFVSMCACHSHPWVHIRSRSCIKSRVATATCHVELIRNWGHNTWGNDQPKHFHRTQTTCNVSSVNRHEWPHPLPSLI